MKRVILVFAFACFVLTMKAQTISEISTGELLDLMKSGEELPKTEVVEEVVFWDESNPNDPLNKLIEANKAKRSQYGMPVPAFTEHPDNPGKSGVVWLDWKSYNHTSAPSANTNNSSEAYIEASAEKQDDYKWVIPEGLAAKDIMSDENGQMSIVLLNGTLARYKEKVNLVKAHGFTEDANENEVPGQMNIYQAESKDGYEVSVMLYQKKLSIIFDKRP